MSHELDRPTVRDRGVDRELRGVFPDERRPVPADSAWEHGLRWATVYGAERLREAMRDAGRPITGPELDYALWHAGVLGPDAARMGEHHRTITMRY